jgi:peptidoglycan/xylan/chitin deacetylase (PgdA/CDA1 family)
MVGSRRAICLTIDLEECTAPLELRGCPLSEQESLKPSEEGAHRLLRVLEREGIDATFFITGFFASKRPELVRRIADMGWEIANHGLRHGPAAGRDGMDGLRASGEILERISGARPLGYRAPRLRIGPGIIKALKRLGYVYDSSILPTYVPGRFNWLGMKASPFSWDLGGEGRLVEIPISVTPILRIPVGWWWFRKNFGSRICKIGFDAIWRRGMPVICNVHPWELSGLPKTYRMPAHVKFNCGAASEAQIRMLIAHGKRAGAEFLRMIDLAESISVDIGGSDPIDPF